jgi:vacuolar protein sorting-associated protein 13A/C
MEREKIRSERSEHVFEGLFSGGKSILNGIGNGIKGVVMDPLVGAEKNGIGGFFLGVAKGVSGLVLKPVTGIIDATTKTAEGIKNTANYLNPK